MSDRPTTSKLPELPSKLIRLGLSDLEKVEKIDGYIVNMVMGSWHTPTPTGCAVCFTGAVMAMTFKTTPTATVVPYAPYFSHQDKDRLHALNSFSNGHIGGAVSDYLGRAISVKLEKKIADCLLPDNVTISSYHLNNESFKEDMRELANLLEKEGL